MIDPAPARLRSPDARGIVGEPLHNGSAGGTRPG
jgi:hypothetical protein